MNFDVVIVGGGMIGAPLAGALANEGLTVCVVDSADVVTPGGSSTDDRGIALSLGSQRILAGLGLWSKLLEFSCAIEHIHVSDRGRIGRTHLTAVDYGLRAFGYVAGAGILGQILRSGLKPPVSVFAPASVVSVDSNPTNVRLLLRHDHQQTSVSATLLVVCDGAHSSTRDLLGIEATEVSYQQFALTTNVKTGKPHENTAYERFTSSGPLAFLPLVNGECAVVWTLSEKDMLCLKDANDEVVLGELQTRFGNRLGQLVSIGKRAIHPLSLTTVAEATAHRAVIIGNAAHALHPIAGQGLNLGFRDLASLAQVVVDTYRSGGDIGCASVLSAFQQQRSLDQSRTTKLTDALVHLFSSDFAAWVYGRNIAMLALDCLPAAKSILVERAIGLAGKQSRLAQGLSL